MRFLKNSFFSLLLFSSLDAKMLHRTQVQMGTFVNISLSAEDKKFFQATFKVIKSVEDALSSYKKGADITLLNHTKSLSLSHYTFEALTLSRWYYEKTDGYFNIAVGSVTKELYHFGEQERLPSKKALKRANLALEGLYFDATNANMDSTMTLDLGGMGKGFGVDKAVEYLKEQNVTRAVVGASGDIRCLDICKIEIHNPLSKHPLASFFTHEKEMGISTSGNYNRYVQDEKHNHLINPQTKESQKNFISITLIGTLPSSDLDAYATAVSVMPTRKAFAFLNSLGLAFLVLDSEKKLYVSENIDSFVDELVINNTFKKNKK